VKKSLSNLTSATATTADKKLDEQFPKHAAVLKQARLGFKEYPTLAEMTRKIEEEEKDSENKKKRRKQYKRQTFLPIAC